MSIDVARFDRQIALPQVDLDGQDSLQQAHVIVVGMGGLGCAAAQSLAMMGINRLTLIDFDKIETSNLARQALYTDEDVGEYKVNAAADKLKQFNPKASINTVNSAFDSLHLGGLTHQQEQACIVLDCTDNMGTRRLINRTCRERALPLVIAGAIRFEGMLMYVPNDVNTPCYECLTQVWPDPNESCVERGIIAPIVNLIGHHQALITAQIILHLTPLPAGEVRLFDGINHSWNTLKFLQSKDCEVCFPLAQKMTTVK